MIKMLFCGVVGFLSYFIGFFLFLYFYVGKRSSEWGDVFLTNWALYSLLLAIIPAVILGIPFGLASTRFYSLDWLYVILSAILIGIVFGFVISVLILSSASLSQQNLSGCAIITVILIVCNIIAVSFIKLFSGGKLQ